MLFVFDLDFTLWDCGGTWCDHTSPPYTKFENHITDMDGRNIRLYDDVKEVLETVAGRGYPLAAASRTHEPSWALELMDLFGITAYFEYREIYPGPKVPHFEVLKNKSGFGYGDMIFFDDEQRNIIDVAELGVRTVHVRGGLKLSDMRGLI